MKIGDVVIDIDGRKKTVHSTLGDGRWLLLQWFEGNTLHCTFRLKTFLNGMMIVVPKKLHGRLAESGIAPDWKSEVTL